MVPPERLVLSRLCLDLQSAEARRDLFSPYEMHRSLLRGFAGPRAAAGLLYRLETGATEAEVLTQSWVEPDWSQLPAGYLQRERPAAVKWWTPEFAAGQQLCFRLRANPTFRRGRRRLAWLREPEQLAWLDRQGERHGFRSLEAWAGSEGLIQMKRAARGVAPITCQVVVFGGFLQVTDPEALARALAAGLGSAKAFGFGLLSLAPPAAVHAGGPG
jgi:CRISPR system Cascade subunit CasE